VTHSIFSWAVFFAIVLFLLAFDLGVLHRRHREISVRESLLLTCGYIVLGLLYGVGIGFALGAESALLYFTGFLVEKSLSIDNIFVISLILTQLRIPAHQQYHVLLYGVLGAIIMRGLMIGVGAAAVAQYAWILYLFAAFLIVTGVKMLFVKETAHDVAQNRLFLWLKNRLHLSPFLLAICLVELTDIMFAVDSIPAIFAITTDPYIVFTSNIFAILGLRALFFALHDMLGRFVYLKYALALVLIFIGSKVFIAHFLQLKQFPSSISLSVTILLIGGGIMLSYCRKK
jgi:tellurite resistance protein TerC